VVPLYYTATSGIDAWVDTTTGLPLDESIDQQVLVGLTVGGQRITLIPVLVVNAKLLPKSIKYLADKASTASTKLTIIKDVVPLVLLVLGLLGLVIALLRRKPQAPAQ
jgi:hypothetical protein